MIQMYVGNTLMLAVDRSNNVMYECSRLEGRTSDLWETPEGFASGNWLPGEINEEALSGMTILWAK